MNEDSVTVDAWSVISWDEPDVSSVRTTCKMKPAPAPTPSFSLDVPRASWQGHVPSLTGKGLPAPVISQRASSSGQQVSCASGLPAPQIRLQTPRSLQQSIDPVHVTADSNQLQLKRKLLAEEDMKFPTQRKPKGVRTKQASSSSLVVQKLWQSLFFKLMQLSTLLQQMHESPNLQAHVDRLLDTFAASTLVKHLSSISQFLQVCGNLRLDLETFSEVQLADALLACRLSPSTLHGMAHVSMIIKALRWAYRTLQIECL